MSKYERGIQAEAEMLDRIQEMFKRYLNSDYKIITDVCYINSSKTISQIDAILICNKGLFCIEFKSWNGIVKATLEDEWLIYNGSFDVRYANPVRQNGMHRAAIDALVHYNVTDLKNEFKSVVVFDDKAILVNEIYDSVQKKNIPLYKNVVKVDDFISFLYANSDKEEIPEQKQEEICKYLEYLKNKYKPRFDEQQRGIINN